LLSLAAFLPSLDSHHARTAILLFLRWKWTVGGFSWKMSAGLMVRRAPYLGKSTFLALFCPKSDYSQGTLEERREKAAYTLFTDNIRDSFEFGHRIQTSVFPQSLHFLNKKYKYLKLEFCVEISRF
jgi:hypothetical protein